MPVYRTNVTLTNPNMGGVGINSWHIRTVGSFGGDIELIQSASSAIEDFYNALMQNIIASDTQVRSDGDFVEVGGSEGAQTADPWSAPPFSAGGAFPAHLAIVAGWGTAVRNRTGYGRTFLGPLRSGTMDGQGTPTDAALTVIRGAMDDLISASQGDTGWSVGIYSRKLQLLRDITSRTVHDQYAVLRSRRL